MKLKLKAFVKKATITSLSDLYSFFKNYPELNTCWSYPDKECVMVEIEGGMELRIDENLHFRLEYEEYYFEKEEHWSLLTTQLSDLLKDLLDQVNSKDFGNLPELVDTLKIFSENVAKDNYKNEINNRTMHYEPLEQDDEGIDL